MVMIIASVRFNLRPGTTLAEVAKLFEASAPKYRDVPGLLTKHYVFGGGKGGGNVGIARGSRAALYRGVAPNDRGSLRMRTRDRMVGEPAHRRQCRRPGPELRSLGRKRMRVLVLPGDGIGPEISAATVEV